jgi:cobyrinic acid a,c-diamide synthase
MAAMTRRGLTVQAFKCGPDYIDPLFHSHITGRPSRNLDPFLLPESTLCYLFRKNSRGADCSIVEGVMGFYDGLGTTTAGSTHEVAKMTKTPTLLAVTARGMSASLAALVKGFVGFRPQSDIAGVLLNETGERLYAPLKTMLARETGVEVLGYMPRMEDCSLESRHLGLVMASEVANLDGKLARLAQQAERSLDLDRILALASVAPASPEGSPPTLACEPRPFRLAVARDEAFCFYYRDALDLLEEAGGQIVFFSPLSDAKLPDADGLYLGGGYPELHGARLAANVSMREDIRRRVAEGLPTFAECGGFIALCDSLRTDEGVFEMCGVLKGDVFMTQRLTRFGYVNLTAKRQSVLAPQGWTGRGHEFHYSDGTNNGDGFIISKPNGSKLGGSQTDGRAWEGIHASPSIHAGYPHLHLCGDPQLAANFARACVEYRSKISHRI